MASRGGRNVIVWSHAEALMYMALLLQLLGAACALVAGPGPGRFRLPEGGENGIYQGFVDENGEMQVKYLGKANTTSPGPNVPVRGIGGPGRKLLDSSPVHCQGTAQSSSDARVAINNLAKYFGGGNFFYVSIAIKENSAVAYGCDYGNGQHATYGRIWNDAYAITNVCGGFDQAGWYAYQDWKSAYGRCSSSWGYC